VGGWGIENENWASRNRIPENGGGGIKIGERASRNFPIAAGGYMGRTGKGGGRVDAGKIRLISKQKHKFGRQECIAMSERSELEAFWAGS